MTNKDWYQRSFSALQMKQEIKLEEKPMKRRHILKPAAITAAAGIFGLSAVVFAADAGGIRTAVETWIGGEKTEVEMEPTDSGTWKFTWTQNGEKREAAARSEALDENGNPVPLNGAETLEQVIPQLEYENGKLYYYDEEKVYDLTSLIQSGRCAFVTEGDDTRWIEAKVEDDCLSYSSLTEPTSGVEYASIANYRIK